MIIIPEFSLTRLKLTAFSYQREEINSVSSFLNEKEIAYTSRPIGKSEDRFGMEFFIVGLRQIQSFQQALLIQFTGAGKNAQTEFLATEGQPFCCKKITRDDRDSESETIYSSDDQAALIKCALLANSKNWIGGVSEPGACRRRTI